ncbi:MAG: O-antigen ligase family protein [Candidatus Omnitrophota bacterium]
MPLPTIQSIAWGIILSYVFFRPFIAESTFSKLDITLNGLLLLAWAGYSLKRQIKIRLIDKTILIFFLSLLLSTINSNNIVVNLAQIYKYLSLIAVFYIIRLSNQEEQKQIFYALVISASLVALYSLHFLFNISGFTLEYLSEHNIRYPFAKEFLASKRAFAPFFSPNLLAGYLIAIIMICLNTIVKRKEEKDWLFFLSTFCLLMSSLALFFTKSVGGWFIFIITFSLFILLGKLLNKKSLMIAFSLIVLLGAIAVNRTLTEVHFKNPLFSLNQRISYWKETIKIIADHPIIGVGVGNFSLKEARAAHNSYLQIWAEMGILGIVSWLVIVFVFIKQGVKNLYSRSGYCCLGILTAGLSFLCYNLIDFSFFISQVAFLFWLLLGLTVKYADTADCLRRAPSDKN